jgi:hypothetical protein
MVVYLKQNWDGVLVLPISVMAYGGFISACMM